MGQFFGQFQYISILKCLAEVDLYQAYNWVVDRNLEGFDIPEILWQWVIFAKELKAHYPEKIA